MGRLPIRHSRRLLLLACLLLLSLRPVLALDPGTPIKQYLVDHWTISDGLPSNLIHSIAQTPDGYLWIATNKGLVRFDGIVFTKIPFAARAEKSSGQNALPEALYFENNTLWIGSSAGLTAYHYQSRQFKTYTAADGLTAGRIRRITRDTGGNLWLGFVSTYVNRFMGGNFFAFNNSHGLGGNIINAIIQNRQGNLLVGTRNNGVFIHNGGRFDPYPVDGLRGFIINLKEDHRGALWITTNKGLLQKNGPNLQTYTVSHGLSNNHTSDLLEDSRRNFWVGSIEGLNRLKKDGAGRITFEHTLKPHVIVSLFEDREGSLWAGTYKSGLFRLKDAGFTTVNLPGAPKGGILFSMFQKKDKEIVIGTDNGKLLRLKDNVPLAPLTVPGLTGTSITAIEEGAGGSLWLGTNGQGALRVNGNSITRLTTQQGLTDGLVTTILSDRQGRLWFGTFDGVSLLPSPGGPVQSLTSRGGLSGNKVHTIHQDKNGNIWVAADRGITVLKNGDIPGPGQKDTLTSILPGVPVTWIYEEPAPPDNDGPVFWLAAPGTGLIRLSFNTRTLVSFTTSHGLTTDFIYRFFEDPRGNFWLISDKGILRVSKAALNRFAAGLARRIDCVVYGVSEGLKNPELNNPFPGHAAFRNQNGELWFMNKKEISVINPGKIRVNKAAPPVVLETVAPGGKAMPLPPGDGGNSFKDTRRIGFSFTAPTLLASEKVTFQYKLEREGESGNWTFLAPGAAREAFFEDLGPGAYTFKVIACNAEGIWNPTGATFSFNLERSFTKTLLFKAVSFFILILLCTVTLFLLYLRFKKPGAPTASPAAAEQEKEKIKYKSSPMPAALARERVKKLEYLMEVEKLYCEDTLSLPSLSEKLGINHHQLSQLLNDTLKQRFFDYVNTYRIEETKKLLTVKGKGRAKTIQEISIEVGFNTMTAFYKAFKKHTGMTPGEYKKQLSI